jgi:hypothetical protein
MTAIAIALRTTATPTVVQKPASYASTKNAVLSNPNSHSVTAPQRWADTLNRLPASMQQLINNYHRTCIARFQMTYPDIKAWSGLRLAEAVSVPLIFICIDTTMQRELSLKWALDIVSEFQPTMVVPIQVYRDPTDPSRYIAWDGQHTLIALWIIAAALGVDMSTIEVPVNIYASSLKSMMRRGLITLNSAQGKKAFTPYDTWCQHTFGVRIDHATFPSWVATAQKQQHLENNDLFVTTKEMADENEPGAIINIQELEKLPVGAVGHLARYLGIVTQGSRAVVGTEMELMAHYFHQCVKAGIKVDDKYIDDLAALTLLLFDADFETNGKFWTKAQDAYLNWHASTPQFTNARFNKHKTHGFPFLIAQLQARFTHKVPQSDSASSFWPDDSDLF